MASINRLQSGRWRCRARVGGKIKSRTFDSHDEAKRWGIRKESEKGAEKCATVGDLFQRYMREVCPQHNGEKWELARLRAMGETWLGDVTLAELNATHVARYRDERLLQVAPGTVNRDLSLLGSVFSTAVKEWLLLDANPVANIRKPSNPPPRDRRISQDEIDLIVANCTRDELRVLFLLGIETGMRLGEMCGITPGAVNGRVVTLKNTKNGSQRFVPLSTKALSLLESVGFRFDITPEQASKAFCDLTRGLGIEDLRFHDTRHEAVTRLAKKVPLLDLARIIGHKDLRSLQTYYNETPDSLAEMLD